VGIAFDFIQTDLMKDLLLKNMSTGPAVYFDKSFAISNLFIEKEAFEQPRSSYRVKLNDTELTLTEKSARYDFGEAIARCSEYFTLKIGDLVFVPAVSFDKGIKQGDIIDGVYGNDVLIRCQVK
jgi:2-keto-4-pentenoate hydratase/2-oxohepta-3-ene-1,7-dioic acid hydratase in catechol pathway